MILYELIDYDILRLICMWALLGVLLIGFALTDGFDMGVGALLPFVARDRCSNAAWRSIPSARFGKAPGLVSSWSAAPSSPPGRRYIAVSFSGFYLAMFVVLAAFIVRPVRVS